MEEYNPEVYWSRVGQEIKKRGENYIAGSDSFYYRYKRDKFLSKYIDTLDFNSKKILELGMGPGGNLRHLAKFQSPQKLTGVDISQTMVDLASQNLSAFNNIVELYKINGKSLPFNDRSFDVSFTVTVLHHNTNEEMFKSIVKELCRVTKNIIIVMENIGNSSHIGGKGSFIGRTISVYRKEFEESYFKMIDLQFLNLKISRTWNLFVGRQYRKIRRFFSNNSPKEGEQINPLVNMLIGLPLPFTRILDEIFREEKDLARMIFYREE